MLRFWDWRKGLKIKELGPVRVVLPPFGSVALAPSARTIAVLNGTGEIAVYDAATGKVVTQVKPNSMAKFGVIGFSPDGTMLSCVNEDGVVTIWDTTNWNAIGTLMPKEIDERRLRLGLGFKLLQLGFSPDGRVFAFTPDARHINVVRTRGDWKALGVINADGIVTGIAYSPDGKVLAAATDTDHISLWEPTTAKKLRQLPKCRAGINCLAFSPDGKKLAAGLRDSTVIVWDVTAFNGLAEKKP